MKQNVRETIKARVMRRVVAVYYLRKILNWTTLKLGILGMLTLAFGSLVHVAAVFDNMPAVTDINGLYHFGSQAFIHTDVMVQGAILGLGILTLWLMKDALKAIHIPTVKLSHV